MTSRMINAAQTPEFMSIMEDWHLARRGPIFPKIINGEHGEPAYFFKIIYKNAAMDYIFGLICEAYGLLWIHLNHF